MVKTQFDKKMERIEKLDLKKWSVDKALCVYIKDGDGNHVQADVIKTSQKIYDWVSK